MKFEFDSIKFLDLATRLLHDENYVNEDARYRTCISRTYYAAHLFTKKKLEEIGVVIKIEKNERKGVIHDKVIEALKMKNEPLAGMLNDLREKRGFADYILNKKFKEYGVGLDIANADFIIKEVNKLKRTVPL